MATIKFNLELTRHDAEITPADLEAKVGAILAEAAAKIQGLFDIREGYERCGHEQSLRHEIVHGDDDDDDEDDFEVVFEPDASFAEKLRQLFGGR